MTHDAFLRASNQEIQGIKGLQSSWQNPYSFIFIADPQPGLIDVIENEGPGDVWDEEIRRVNIAIKAINQMVPKPKFVCIGGDILNAFPQPQDGANSIRESQFSDIKSAFSNLDSSIPIISVSGNHDVGNTPTPETISMYQKFYGDDYFSFNMNGVFYIVLNSQYYFDSSQCKNLAHKQNEWLDLQLEKSKSEIYKHTIVFMHIPLFITDPDEEDYYFNIPKETRKTLLHKFASAGVSKVFCGHYHRNAGGHWSTNSNTDNSKTRDIEVIVSSAVGCQLGEDSSGIRIVNVLDEKVIHQYFPLEKIPTSSLLF